MLLTILLSIESFYKHFKIIAACHISNYIIKMQEKDGKIIMVWGKINLGKGMQNTWEKTSELSRALDVSLKSTLYLWVTPEFTQSLKVQELEKIHSASVESYLVKLGEASMVC